MNPIASLVDLMGPVEMHNDECVTYFDRQNAEIVSVERSILGAVEDGEDEGLEDDVPAWQKHEVEEARAIVADKSGRFIDPPDKVEFDEYRHMERFIESITNARIADQLWRAINGRSPFRVFKETLHTLGLEKRWYRYRDRAIKQFVIEWAEDNHVAYKDDLKREYK
jgi:hypothetical protein